MATTPNTLTTAEAAVLLREAQDRFIASWGRMGSAWGISRTMAEVHALLYVTGEPMNTDEIMDRLAISRGNVSMSVRALLDWGVIQRVHKRGDRKDYFHAEQDVWAMLRAIARERIKREVDPLLQSLSEIRELTPETTKATPEDIAGLNQRLDAVQECFELLSVLSQKFAGPTGTGLQMAAKLLAKMPTRGGAS
jgi:HTH-type transcriptional regulator, glycine betaine synthesis regulator